MNTTKIDYVTTPSKEDHLRLVHEMNHNIVHLRVDKRTAICSDQGLNDLGYLSSNKHIDQEIQNYLLNFAVYYRKYSIILSYLSCNKSLTEKSIERIISYIKGYDWEKYKFEIGTLCMDPPHMGRFIFNVQKHNNAISDEFREKLMQVYPNYIQYDYESIVNGFDRYLLISENPLPG